MFALKIRRYGRSQRPRSERGEAQSREPWRVIALASQSAEIRAEERIEDV
jgi:hypothetical protein